MIHSNLILFLGALLFWSGTWSIIGLTQVNIDLDPTISVFIRFILSGMIILIYVALTKRKLSFSIKDHLYFFVLGVFLYSGNYIFFYHSNVYLPSNIPATVFCLLTIFNILGEWNAVIESYEKNGAKIKIMGKVRDKDNEKNICELAKDIVKGVNKQEVVSIPKIIKKTGFFEKLFHFFR